MVLYQKKPKDKGVVVLASLASLAFLIAAGKVSLSDSNPPDTSENLNSRSQVSSAPVVSYSEREGSASSRSFPRIPRRNGLRPADPFETMEGILTDNPFAVTLFSQLDFPTTVCYEASTGNCYTSNEENLGYHPGRTCFSNPFAAVYLQESSALEALTTRFAEHEFLLKHDLSPPAATVTDFMNQKMEGTLYGLDGLTTSQEDGNSAAFHSFRRWREDLYAAAQRSDTKRIRELAVLFTPGFEDQGCSAFISYASSEQRCALQEAQETPYPLDLLFGHSGY